MKPGKIDISQFANYLELVPDIKGFSRKMLMELYVAKCQDLRINAGKQQMTRFFEIILKNQQA